MFEEWEDFGIRFGPFGVAVGGAGRVGPSAAAAESQRKTPTVLDSV
jgi:hypothetical protein